MRTLHELPRFGDRWSYLYLEMGTLHQTAAGLAFRNKQGDRDVPIDQLCVVMLGPGTTITHAAVKALAQNNCLLAWVGQDGVRLYAHSTGGTFSARRLLWQARLTSDEKERLGVVYRMYQKRFPGTELGGKSIEQVRGMEGMRVRSAYGALAKEYGIEWTGRDYNQDDWFHATPANRALSAANACLYGVCHAGIVSAGYSAGLGFVHTGKMLSFVYDVADFYKVEVTVPVAFRMVAAGEENLERRVRLECRQAFHDAKLMERILPDIAEVLHVADDTGESAEELEGRAVTLADRAGDRGVPRQSEPKSEGGAMEDSDQEGG
jgi:CRISPR-associated protein Cas1